MKFNLIDTIKGIATGTINSIFIKKEIEQMAEERLALCKTCPYNSDSAKKSGYKTNRFDFHCTVCGCVLKLKTRYPSSHCPLGDPGYGEEIEKQKPKWLSMATDEESEQIMKLLEKNNTDGNKDN